MQAQSGPGPAPAASAQSQRSDGLSAKRRDRLWAACLLLIRGCGAAVTPPATPGAQAPLGLALGNAHPSLPACSDGWGRRRLKQNKGGDFLCRVLLALVALAPAWLRRLHPSCCSFPKICTLWTYGFFPSVLPLPAGGGGGQEGAGALPSQVEGLRGRPRRRQLAAPEGDDARGCCAAPPALPCRTACCMHKAHATAWALLWKRRAACVCVWGAPQPMLAGCRHGQGGVQPVPPPLASARARGARALASSARHRLSPGACPTGAGAHRPACASLPRRATLQCNRLLDEWKQEGRAEWELARRQLLDEAGLA